MAWCQVPENIHDPLDDLEQDENSPSVNVKDQCIHNKAIEVMQTACYIELKRFSS